MGADDRAMITTESPVPALLAAWQRDLSRRNLRPRTRTVYAERVDLLVRWAGARHLLDLGTADLEAWMDSRRTADGRPVGAATRTAYVAALKSLYGWAAEHELVAVDPSRKLVRPKVRPGRPRPVADDVLADAARAARPETRVMILLGALAGLRVSEIAGLDVADVDLTAGLLEVVDGKGGKNRVVPLHPVLADALRCLPLPRSGPLFLTTSGRPMSGHAVGDRIRQVLPTGTPHALRHFAGTSWWLASHDIRTVAELLGHSDPRTSLVYSRWDVAAGRAAVQGMTLPTL